MKYMVSTKVPKSQVEPPVNPDVGHDDDQHVTVLIGEDLSELKNVDELEDGQPSVSTESLGAQVVATECATCEPRNEYPPCVSRVIDADGNARISIVLGQPERTKWLATVIGLLDSASENDQVDITIVDCPRCDDLYSHRSLLSSIDRCRANVITHAGCLSNIGDIALWLAGDELRWSKKMTAIFTRQQFAGYGGDIRDLVGKSKDAEFSFKEYRDYISKRGLFTRAELDTMYETRGMLTLFRDVLEARVTGLKQVTDD